MNTMPASGRVAPLQRRGIAALLDRLLLVTVAAVLGLLYWVVGTGQVFPIAVVLGGVLVLAYLIVQWWAYARRGAGLGYAATGLELVSIRDGRPIGWARTLLRAVVLGVLTGSVLGVVAMVIVMLGQQRRRGWHDLAAGSVVIQPGTPTVAAPSAPVQQRGFRTIVPTAPLPTERLHAALQPQAEPPAASEPIRSVPGSPPSPDRAPVSEGPAAPPVPAATQRRISRVRLPRVSQALAEHSATVLAPAPQPGEPAEAGWYLLLDDGRELQLDKPVLIGRAPEPSQEDGDVQLVTCGEPDGSVSKTHLLVGADRFGTYVVDRDSTNGTAVVGAEIGLRPCVPNEVTRLWHGQRVNYGQRWLLARRRAG